MDWQIDKEIDNLIDIIFSLFFPSIFIGTRRRMKYIRMVKCDATGTVNMTDNTMVCGSELIK